MAILFTDGFDSYGTTTGTNLLTRWTAASFPNNFSSAVTPYTYGQSHTPGNSAVSNTSTIGFTATSTVTIGAAIYTSGFNNSVSWPMIGLLSAGTWMMGLTVLGDGSIIVSRMTSGSAGTTVSTSSAGVIKINTWYYIELSITISDTVGTVRVDVNGSTVINATGLDTRNGTPADVNTLSLGNNNGNTVYFDDVYITNTITPLGPQRIYTLRPNADTAQKQWTPLSGVNNYAMVNETIIDGDTSYVSATNVNDFDLYDVANYVPSTASIACVNQLVWARKTDATARTLALSTKSGSVTTDSSAVALNTSYTGYSRIYETDPNTSSAWTISGINALQIGQKVIS